MKLTFGKKQLFCQRLIKKKPISLYRIQFSKFFYKTHRNHKV
jgi:hypothetical protein